QLSSCDFVATFHQCQSRCCCPAPTIDKPTRERAARTIPSFIQGNCEQDAGRELQALAPALHLRTRVGQADWIVAVPYSRQTRDAGRRVRTRFVDQDCGKTSAAEAAKTILLASALRRHWRSSTPTPLLHSAVTQLMTRGGGALPQLAAGIRLRVLRERDETQTTLQKKCLALENSLIASENHGAASHSGEYLEFLLRTSTNHQVSKALTSPPPLSRATMSELRSATTRTTHSDRMAEEEDGCDQPWRPGAHKMRMNQHQQRRTIAWTFTVTA
ncbi:hypothetical protein PybrP1_012806, partial [[Pythium] brassicae (nom. inval.)]